MIYRPAPDDDTLLDIAAARMICERPAATIRARCPAAACDRVTHHLLYSQRDLIRLVIQADVARRTKHARPTRRKHAA